MKWVVFSVLVNSWESINILSCTAVAQCEYKPCPWASLMPGSGAGERVAVNSLQWGLSLKRPNEHAQTPARPQRKVCGFFSGNLLETNSACHFHCRQSVQGSPPQRAALRTTAARQQFDLAETENASRQTLFCRIIAIVWKLL